MSPVIAEINDMSVFAVPDSIYIGLADIKTASAWYPEKLGLRVFPSTMDDAGGCVPLAFGKNAETAVVLGPVGGAADVAAMLYAGGAERARDFFSSRGGAMSVLSNKTAREPATSSYEIWKASK
jgi:hypothetical protein